MSPAANVDFHDFHDEDKWTWAAAVAISAALRRGLDQHLRARLLVSGGHTPAPVFEALARAPLEWSRIDIGLVDERWLPADDPDSNAHLVRQHLLQGHAADASFQPITAPGRSIEQAVSHANLDATQRPDVVLLGMGGDGHTASLFPGMQDLGTALASEDAYVITDGSGCPGAGAWPCRISLTPAGLQRARTRLLLIRGQDKRKMFTRALEGDDARELPVRIAFTTPGARLQVYWCP